MSRIARFVLFVFCTFAITGALFVLGHPRVGALELAPGAAAKVNKFPGPPPICPRWAYEPWVWEDNGNTRKSIEDLVEGYRSRNIPVGAVLIDSPWSTAYNNFEWDTERYPKPQEMIDRFHAKGVKVVLWLTGVVNRKSKDTPLQQSPTYELVKKRGYAVNGGRDYTWWKGEGVHIDFTNARAKAWWHTQLDKVLDMGIDGWKTDVGSLMIGPFVDTSIGTITRSQFCRYYYADTIDYSLTKNPAALITGRPYSFQGGFAVPISKCTTSFSGDFSGDWDGLKNQLSNIYISAQAGYGALGCEVGGYFITPPNKEQFIRYAQLGSMMPVMNNGGMNGGLAEHLPWYHDEETVEIYRYFATLHSELVPYLFSCGVESHLQDIPILLASNTIEGCHHLGKDLFVSAIVADTTSKSFSLPRWGTWIDYWDDSKVYQPGEGLKYAVPLDRYPIFIRAGAVLPMFVKNSFTGHGDETSLDKQTLVFYPFNETHYTYHMPTGDGVDYEDVRIDVDERAGTIGVNSPREETFRLRVKCFAKPKAVTGADSWSYDAKANYIVIDKRGKQFMIAIRALRAYGSILDAL